MEAIKHHDKTIEVKLKGPIPVGVIFESLYLTPTSPRLFMC